MRQSKTLLTLNERGSKLARNSVFSCHLSPIGRQMAIDIFFSNYFDLRSSIVLTFCKCRLSGVGSGLLRMIMHAVYIAILAGKVVKGLNLFGIRNTDKYICI